MFNLMCVIIPHIRLEILENIPNSLYIQIISLSIIETRSMKLVVIIYLHTCYFLIMSSDSET